VKKWTCIDRALTPDGKPMSLEEHDGTYSIRVDGAPLMSTRQHGSEEKLAEWACAPARDKAGARVLIGGLGFGFTLRAALAVVAGDAVVVVAELLGAVIDWNRSPDFPFAAAALADPRVQVAQADVGDIIEQSRASFDSIILDVDNGPGALSVVGNHRLYDVGGLRRARAALRPGGCFGVWSAAPDPEFERRMAEAGFRVAARPCRAHANSGRRHTIFLGRLEEARTRLY
jgi:spermidine synthase